jgi:hypothetical protein
MSDHIQKTIEDAKADLRKHEEAVVNTKKLINQLCAFAKMPAMFADADLQVGGSTASTVIRKNSFYGRPLATCVREFLEARKTMGLGAASLDEIMAALREGSYDLEEITKDKDGQKRGVAISLVKNGAVFHRLPNDDFGLLAWYPNAKAKKNKSAKVGESEKTAVADDTNEEKQEAVKK